VTYKIREEIVIKKNFNEFYTLTFVFTAEA